MAINALIAEGVQPIGRDMPAIANMLQQRQQQQFQNTLATQQNARAQGEYDLNVKKYQTEQQQAQDDHFRQGFGYLLQQLEQFAGDPERYKSSLAAIEQSPNFRQGQEWAARNGVDLKALENPQNLGLVRAQARIAPIEPKYQAIGPNGVLKINANGTNESIGVPPVKPPAPSAEMQGFEQWKKDRGGNGTYEQYLRAKASAERSPNAQEPTLQRITRPNADGTLQDYTFNPKTGETRPMDAPYQKPVTLSPKDADAAKAKLTAIKLARTQLQQARDKFAALKDSYSVGMGGKLFPTVAGKNLDAAIDGMRQTITGLTRTPGIGSMSDFETRLNQAQLPNRNDYEETYGQKLDQLGSMLDVLESGYTDMVQPSKPGAPSPQPSPQPTAPPAATPKRRVKVDENGNVIG